MAGAGKDRIQVIKSELPKFIRDFKEKANLPEPCDVNSKRSTLIDNTSGEDSGNDELRPDEAPVVTVDEGISLEEAYSFTKKAYGENALLDSTSDLKVKRKHDEENTSEESGKVFFKKPAKEEKQKSSKKQKSKMPEIKNKALLSFNDDEDV